MASVALLVGMIRNAPPHYRGQPLALLIGMSLPVLGSILYVLGLSPIRRMDLSPVLVGVGGIAISWGLFRYRLFQIVPVARNKVFEVIGDGVIVLNVFGQVVDLNRAAQVTLGKSSSRLQGRMGFLS